MTTILRYKYGFLLSSKNPDEDYFRNQVESISNCHAKDGRHYSASVTSDGSRDLSAFKHISSLLTFGVKIVLIVRPRGIGLGAALNQGVDKINATKVLRVDDDDECLINRCDLYEEAIRERGRIGVFGTGAIFDDFHGKKSQVLYPQLHAEIGINLKKHNCVCHPSLVTDKSIIQKYKYSESDSYGAEDWDLWLRAYDSGVTFYNSPQFAIKYRYSSNRQLTPRKVSKRLRANLRIVFKHRLSPNVLILNIVLAVFYYIKWFLYVTR